MLKKEAIKRHSEEKEGIEKAKNNKPIESNYGSF